MLSYGFLAFPNTGTTTAVVSRISLVSPHRIKVLAAYLIPITGTDLYGVWAGWPPAAHIPPGVQWSQRQRASGAKIPPTHGHQLINILLVLKRVGFVGSVDGLDVYYSAGGNQYLLHTFSKIVVWTWGKPYTCPNPAGP